MFSFKNSFILISFTNENFGNLSLTISLNHGSNLFNWGTLGYSILDNILKIIFDDTICFQCRTCTSTQYKNIKGKKNSDKIIYTRFEKWC